MGPASTEGRGEEPEAAHEELPPLRGRTGLPLPPCLLHAVAPQRYGSRREEDVFLRFLSPGSQNASRGWVSCWSGYLIGKSTVQDLFFGMGTAVGVSLTVKPFYTLKE